jgi:hypothetical protein
MRKIMRLVPVLAAAALAAACGSTGTSTSTGTETFTSAPLSYAQLMTSKSTTFRLTWSGPVSATGTFSTGSGQPAPGQPHVFLTSKGIMVALITAVPENKGNGSTPVTLDRAACRYGGVTRVDFIVTGGTGSWAGATGPGSVTADFAFTMPRFTTGAHKGQCNLSNSAQPLRSPAPAASFNGSVRLTLQKLQARHAKGHA